MGMIVHLAIKVDVDTLRGHREGVPNLLRLFDRMGIRASFFFSLGPDNSGKAVRRLLRPGFLTKMCRTKAPSTYGWKTLFYGTLLPAPLIAGPNPQMLQDTVRSGHDCGIHAWDHVKWQDLLPRIPPEELAADFDRACGLFEEIAGRPPRACAAPGWQVTAASLHMQERKGFLYCSDCRGQEPFLPVVEGKALRTMQIPTTLPTLDECLGTPGTTDASLKDAYLALLQCDPATSAAQESPGPRTPKHILHVHTVHAEMEGLSKLDLFASFLAECRAREVRFTALDDVARTTKPEGLPLCPVEKGTLPGRAGTVGLQGDPLVPWMYRLA
jgi:peptidoglycan/xylan/chitin deacetylase (PgdA/CDA1 family)